MNEVYPSECISFRYMINPRQSHYQVDGCQETLAAERVASTALSSNTSLAIKPAKGELVRPVQTPSRTEGSDSGSGTRELFEAQVTIMASREPLEAGFPAAVISGSVSRTKDALDEAIEEARLVKDLVSLTVKHENHS